jgi:hypothetical protein
LDAYEVGGTKELEFQKEAPLSADVTDLMGDEEQLEWYKKVMKWTQENKSAYLRVKSVQTCISLLFLGTTFILYHYRWMKSSPDDPLISCIRLIMVLLLCDLATFLCDFVMVLKRNWFFISLRYITSSVSVTIGVMVQIDFGLTSYNGGEVRLDLKSSL